ncbi:MAG TPA: rhodanese-like domain-containing protein [Gammaproteobacteria bacterium]|nr:rhodanese-like domain-containing protein [Gammaproteobacteria bacterium]
MKSVLLASSLIALSMTLAPVQAADLKVKITGSLSSVTVKHQGKDVVIQRNQNVENTVNPAFAKTSRECPPFCINPMELAAGVDTIGEVEMLDYLGKMSSGDSSILVVDSRTPDWVERGTIPGSINIPWNKLNPQQGASPFDISDIMIKQFGVKDLEGLWDYSGAKTLVMFCNGAWCGQSPNNIQNLLKFGYPPSKIKWYRGGMQDWESLGLTTVKP